MCDVFTHVGNSLCTITDGHAHTSRALICTWTPTANNETTVSEMLKKYSQCYMEAAHIQPSFSGPEERRTSALQEPSAQQMHPSPFCYLP